MLAVEDLGQREVVARVRLRPGAHRDAEAGAAGLEAVHGDDERVLAARRVVAVGVAAAEEHLVLDRDPVQLARAHADERERPVLERFLLDLEAVVPALRTPEPDAGRQEELLPRVRADRVAEARLVVAALEPVAAGVLIVGPADRQIRGRVEVVVDDRAVPHGRADDAEAAAGERLQEAVEGLGLDHACLDVGQAVLSSADVRNRGESLHRCRPHLDHGLSAATSRASRLLLECRAARVETCRRESAAVSAFAASSRGSASARSCTDWPDETGSEASS